MFDKHIDNALENIMKRCEERLSVLFPKGVPGAIEKRYAQELSFLSHSDYIDDFEIFRRLSQEAEKSGNLMIARGTFSGSFLYYLLGNHCYNPLPVYYYCKRCGHYEEVKTHLFGIDLLGKECPVCGNQVTADGFNFQPESVWGVHGDKTISFEYNVSSDFMHFAGRVIESCYGKGTAYVLPWGMYSIKDSDAEERITGISQVGYVVIPADVPWPDEIISTLDSGEMCLIGGSWILKEYSCKPVYLYMDSDLDKLLRFQRETGYYVAEIHTGKNGIGALTWRNYVNTGVLEGKALGYFSQLKPLIFTDMIAYDMSVHNSFSGEDDCRDAWSFMKMISKESFRKYPCYSREDFFEYLLEAGVDRETAFLASEYIRKGFACSTAFRERFEKLEIPEEIKDVARNYKFVFPRAHEIEFFMVKAKLAWYCKSFPKKFPRILFEE